MSPRAQLCPSPPPRPVAHAGNDVARCPGAHSGLWLALSPQRYPVGPPAGSWCALCPWPGPFPSPPLEPQPSEAPWLSWRRQDFFPLLLSGPLEGSIVSQSPWNHPAWDFNCWLLASTVCQAPCWELCRCHRTWSPWCPESGGCPTTRLRGGTGSLVTSPRFYLQPCQSQVSDRRPPYCPGAVVPCHPGPQGPSPVGGGVC